MAKAKITPKGAIKVIVADSNGQPRVLGSIPVWENMTPTQKYVMDNSGCELTAQLVYVDSSEEFSMENEVSLKTNETKIIHSNYKVKIKEV